LRKIVKRFKNTIHLSLLMFFLFFYIFDNLLISVCDWAPSTLCLFILVHKVSLGYRIKKLFDLSFTLSKEDMKWNILTLRYSISQQWKIYKYNSSFLYYMVVDLCEHLKTNKRCRSHIFLFIIFLHSLIKKKNICMTLLSFIS